ncbi:lipid asymmetry maintenance protein MlaB [Enterobacteriaceae bacterium LUAb1]
MNHRLNWNSDNRTLHLQGELMSETLLPLWQQRDELLNHCQDIDVSALSRVDSAGVALLVHFRHFKTPAIEISGRTAQLDALIILYNLRSLMSSS